MKSPETCTELPVPTALLPSAGSVRRAGAAVSSLLCFTDEEAECRVGSDSPAVPAGARGFPCGACALVPFGLLGSPVSVSAGPP